MEDRAVGGDRVGILGVGVAVDLVVCEASGEERRRLEEDNGRLRVEAEQYKMQCKLLEAELRETLQTVKVMTGELEKANNHRIQQ